MLTQPIVFTKFNKSNLFSEEYPYIIKIDLRLDLKKKIIISHQGRRCTEAFFFFWGTKESPKKRKHHRLVRRPFFIRGQLEHRLVQSTNLCSTHAAIMTSIFFFFFSFLGLQWHFYPIHYGTEEKKKQR